MYWRESRRGPDWRERSAVRSIGLGADRGERESEHRGRYAAAGRNCSGSIRWRAAYRGVLPRPGNAGEYLRPTGVEAGHGGGWWREPRCGTSAAQAGGRAGRTSNGLSTGPKGYKRSDKRIMEDVCDAFMLDERLDPPD